MNSNKPTIWFRLYAEFANDPKVQMLSEADQRRFIMLLCLRCSNGDVTLHDEHIAFQLRISNDEWLGTKQVLMSKNLISEENKPTAWDKRQFVSDSSTARVAAHRERKKQRCNVTVTPPETETETETETEIKKNIMPTALSTPPEKTPGKVDPLPCPVEKIVEIYHASLPDNPRCKVLNERRKASIKARWREAAKLNIKPFGYADQATGLQAWREFFEVCAQSDFLTGRVTPKPGFPPFVATLDFLVSPEKFAKALENHYHRIPA